MKDVKIYQIFYNEETENKIDPGFIPFNNKNNARPDWYEYYSIKQILENEENLNCDWLGVFSPKFFEKTGMKSEEVFSIIKNSNADIISFSPWYAAIALHWNIFDQIASRHNGTIDMFKKIFPLLKCSDDILLMPMGRNNTIYCNYFVAKPKVWRIWKEAFDIIYNLLEVGTSGFKEFTYYSSDEYYNKTENKIFILESLITIISLIYNFKVDFGTNLSTCVIGYGIGNNEKNSIEFLEYMESFKTNGQAANNQKVIEEFYEIVNQYLVISRCRQIQ